MSHLRTLGLRPRVPPEMLPRLLNGLLDGLVMQYFMDASALTEEDVISAVETLALSLFEMA